MLKSISPQELKAKLEAKEDILVVDIRDSYEYEESHLPAINIPMDTMLNNLHQLNREQNIVFYCRSGLRGQATIYMLQRMHNYTNLINLEGGIEAYQSLN